MRSAALRDASTSGTKQIDYYSAMLNVINSIAGLEGVSGEIMSAQKDLIDKSLCFAADINDVSDIMSYFESAVKGIAIMESTMSTKLLHVTEIMTTCMPDCDTTQFATVCGVCWNESFGFIPLWGSKWILTGPDGTSKILTANSDGSIYMGALRYNSSYTLVQMTPPESEAGGDWIIPPGTDTHTIQVDSEGNVTLDDQSNLIIFNERA
jgi:hypothetical protein